MKAAIILKISALLMLGLSLEAEALTVKTNDYGTIHDGIKVHQFVLTNDHGMTVKVLDYGGTITDISVPDKKGVMTNIMLELPDVAAYEARPNFSTLVGRFANRIGDGGFTLDGKFYPLPSTSNNNITLHGGPEGFFKKMWQGASFSNKEECGVRMSYVSPDGESGFPGELNTTATFSLNNKNELIIQYQATTSKPTVVNFTHHMFINLNSWGSIADHLIRINASHYLPISEKVVTGEIAPVEGTPFDLRQLTPISKGLNTKDSQIDAGLGFDHNFVLDQKQAGALTEATQLYSKDSGIQMTISTTEPGIQFYTGNFFNGKLKDKSGRPIEKRFALALEPQHYPDSPHHDNFPSTVLRPGEVFKSKTVYRIETVRDAKH